MEIFFLKLLVVAMIGFGVYGSVVIFGTLYSLPFVGYAVATKGRTERKRKAKPASLYSPSSTTAMLTAETAYEFVGKLGDDDKKEEYLALLDTTKKLLVDMSKRPEMYPDDQAKFAWEQLRKSAAKSRVAGSVESAKFKKLAQQFIQDELARLGGN